MRKSYRLGWIALSLSAISVIASSQESITPRRVFAVDPQNLTPLDSMRAGENINRFFSRGGIALGIGGSPRVNLESSAYQLSVYGPAKKVQRPDGTVVYEENIKWELYIDTYVVDALGEPLRSIKEYLFSKKGSPVALRLPFAYWNTRRGDVKQFWLAGQFDAGGRLIPLNLAGNDNVDVNGAGTVSYTQQINIDFDLNRTANNLFVEFTPIYSFVVGDGLKETLATTPDDERSVHSGLDYRIGIKFGSPNPRSISIAGTRSFRELRGAKNLLSLVFSASAL